MDVIIFGVKIPIVFLILFIVILLFLLLECLKCLVNCITCKSLRDFIFGIYSCTGCILKIICCPFISLYEMLYFGFYGQRASQPEQRWQPVSSEEV